MVECMVCGGGGGAALILAADYGFRDSEGYS